MNENQTPSTTSQQPVSRAQNKRTIKDTLEGDAFKMAVAKVLPKHLTAERFVRVAIMAMTRTPKLAQCDQASFFQALMNLSQMGLEPDGRRAHLIPFENRKRGCVECQLIVDYKGLAELVMRSGMVSNIHADVVCENDEFNYDRGALTSHKINFREPRGKVYAAYALCRFKDGSEKCEVMTAVEVEGIRNRSRAGNNGPWVTDWNEMAKKTAFRRLSKWLSLSPEFRDALDKDQDAMEDIRLDNAKTIEVSRATFELPEPAQEAEAEAETPENTPAQPEAEQPTEKPKAGRPVTNYVKAVKGLLALANHSEVDLIAFLHQTGQLDESIATLVEMAKVADVTLKKIHDEWSTYDAEIKRGKAAVAA